MHYLGIILACVFAYLYGSVLWSVHISKWVKNVNIYAVGSKNPGATNTLRVLGRRWALVVALLDGYKVIITSWVAFGLSMINHDLFSETSYIIPCIFALIGHCWPVWYKFKGGKAVSCFCGLIIVVSHSIFVVFFVVWWIVAFAYRRVSLSSIVATASIFIVMFLPWIYGTDLFIYQWNGWSGFVPTWQQHFEVLVFHNWLHTITPHQFADGMLTGQICIIVGAVILTLRHIPNMKRLKLGIEAPIYPKKKKTKTP